MSMALDARFRRWLPPAAGILLLVVGLLAGFGHSRAGTTPLWNDKPVAVTPATVTAPNWPALTQALKPAVVNVSTRRVSTDEREAIDPFFQRFFGQAPRRSERALGSGFVINSEGYIVTNNHVVDGATEIRVKLDDGRELTAKIAGRDSRTDIALLKVEARGLPVIPIGDSAALRVGEPVMAIGNPFGLEQTVTTGIVSATGRVIGEGPYDDFIQTDASINPGNSGGPLINAAGEAVGINTAIVSRGGGSVGIGFAIPTNLAKPVLTQLAAAGHVERGWLGVAIQPLTPDLAKGFALPGHDGALVSSVTEGSPAAKAGLKPGDVIVKYDGRKVARAADLPRAVADTPVGRAVALQVIRDGATMTLTATVARLEEPREAMADADTSPTAAPTLGVTGRTLTPSVAQQLGLHDSRGVLVVGVQDGSRADDAGLKAGDVIAEVDHRTMASVQELQTAVRTHRSGAPLLVLVHRDGERLWLAVAA
jgi:serine protease Do